MQRLYSNGLEHIFDAMYQTFIDYDEEFSFYNTIIKEFDKDKVLELGCGTGNLASRFIKAQVNYIGLDLSWDMIQLSSAKNPDGTFVQGDITDFKLAEQIDAIIIPGRTTSYLTTNVKVQNALKAIYENLSTGGLLCFDFIDAERFFKEIQLGKNMRHEAYYKNEHFIRDSYMEVIPATNRMFRWDSVYFKNSHGKKELIIEDSSVVRAFTCQEWGKKLKQSGFKLIEFIDRKTYAFDTYVVVATKE